MKIPIIIFALALWFIVPEVVTLEDLKWKKRVVLFFPESDDFLMEVSDSLRVEIEIRDIIYFVIADSLQSNGKYLMEEAYIEALKKKYLLGAKDACWVLLGKDGGMKARYEAPLDWHEALQTVDDRNLRGELVSW
ncbi:MAG TPA: DUF4174 domain-containing protein [Cyclobacteriaceae bacterium]|nr:DUF4174 domain-containing protein [Cyclobacteriaceae bacterium]